MCHVSEWAAEVVGGQESEVVESQSYSTLRGDTTDITMQMTQKPWKSLPAR